MLRLLHKEVIMTKESGAFPSPNVVKSRYGPLATPDGAGGVLKTEGGLNELTISFSGQVINDDSEQRRTIPAGSRVFSAFVEIEEVFVLTGTTPTILVGRDGAEVTDGIVIDEGEADTVGTYDVTTSVAGTFGTATTSSMSTKS